MLWMVEKTGAAKAKCRSLSESSSEATRCVGIEVAEGRCAELGQCSQPEQRKEFTWLRGRSKDG